MKKRVWSGILTLCMAVSLLPTGVCATAAGAAPPVELGSVADYQNVLDATYDENGLRVAKIGYHDGEQLRGAKCGILNQDGNWVAQPIYDKIEPIAHHMRIKAYEKDFGSGRNPVTPVVLIGGYTQAVRDGKMGLLNKNGEEVIPCQYDFVQMPSEGMAAVYKTIDKDTSYVGYWSLEQNREVVTPNQYVTDASYIGCRIGNPDRESSFRQKPTGDYTQVYDFMDGYALVTLPGDTNISVTRTGIAFQAKNAMIIDKTGKEVLSKTYPAFLDTRDYSVYPQKGCYLSFVEKMDLRNYLWIKYSGNPKAKGDAPLDVTYTYGAGMVSPAGVQIRPTYTTGVIASAGEGQFFINPATFHVYPEANLILTTVDAWPGILYGGADTAIDLKGRTKVPPMQDLTNDAFWYDAAYQLLATPNAVYKATGKKIFSHNGGTGGFSVENGCAMISSVGDYIRTDARNGYYAITKYAVDYKGNVLNLTKRMHWPLQEGQGKDKVQQAGNLSVNGTLWVQNNERKWGLLDMTGKAILPFVYDDVNHGAWADKDLPYAVVTQNGKKGLMGPRGELLTPIEYTDLGALRGETVLEAVKGEKKGLVDIKTGKVTLPVNYDRIGVLALFNQWNPDYFATGSCVARIGKDIVFVDRAGNEVCTRKYSATNSEQNVINEAVDGLYEVHEGQIDNRGRVIFPTVRMRDATIEFATSGVVFQKDGKVYRRSANGFAKNYTPKPYAPQTATAAPAATKLIVDGKNVAVDAYTIGRNTYIKLRDLATLVSGSPKSFDVRWDDAKGAIRLVSGTPYTAVGGEFARGDGKSKSATRSSAKILLDGGEVSMTAYTIGRNHYFKLRDVMQLFDVAVDYDDATATVLMDTAQSYPLTGDALRYQQADARAYAEASAQLEADGTIRQSQIYKEPVITCTGTPYKLEYAVGDAFDSTGFRAQYQDIYGNGTNLSAEFTFDVDGIPIATGYIFREAGKKTVNCSYAGKWHNSFVVNVYEKQTEKEVPLVDGGSYYMMLMGKYVTAVNGKWMELKTEQPELPFTVRYLGVDIETGHHLYHVIYNDSTVYYHGWGKGAQLISGGDIDQPHKWRIAKYASFWTMRDEQDQAMVVNASGEASQDGTHVIIWPHKGKAPNNAKIQFIPAT